MNSIFEHIILKEELSQSEVFGSNYDVLLENENSSSIINPLIEDVGELLNCILLKYDELTEFQKKVLEKLFEEFNNIRFNIDPHRLKPFEHCFNNDNELLLYRMSSKGLINIIINPDECSAFSFIPNNLKEKRVFYFIKNNGDFEKLAYNFLSY